MRLELRRIQWLLNRLFDHVIDEHGLTEVNVEQPFYWVIPEDKKYDMDHMPAELDVGSLVDDWEFVQGILQEGNQPVAHSLAEISHLVAAIGEITSRQLAKKGG